MLSTPPTLKDICEKAGVSKALASVVLNGKVGRIKASEETKKKILEAAALLGYEPDRNARALRMSRSFLIGVIAYDISSSFIPQILSGIQRGFMHTNYSVLPSSYDSEEEFLECMESFRRRKVDGLIVISTAVPKLQERFSSWNKVAKVFMGCNPQLPLSSSVSSDGFAIGKNAAEAFLLRNRQYFMHLTYSSSCNASGWNETLDSALIPKENRFTVKTRFDIDECTQQTIDFLTVHPEIDAIFADSDLMAASAMKAAVSLGKKIPDEIDIIGVDNSSYCELTTPTLSSIKQPKFSQGEVAASLMLQLLNEGKEENVILPVELIVRESIKKI